MAAVIFVLTLFCVPVLADPGGFPRWLLLSALLPLLYAASPAPLACTRPAAALGWLFLAGAALTLSWSPNPADAAWGWWQLVLLALAFALAAAQTPAGWIWLRRAFLAGLTVNGVIAAAWMLGIDAGLPSFAPPSATFANRLFLAEAGAIALAWAVSSRSWWAVPGCALAALLPQSRGALLALIVAAAWWALRRRSWPALLPIAALTALGAWIASGRGFDGSSEARLAVAQDTLAALSPAGWGLGSFWTMYPAIAATPAPAVWRFDIGVPHAYSAYLQLAAELGLLALPLAALLVFAWWRADDELRPPLLVVAGLGLAGVPHLSPVAGIVAACLAGRACRRRDDRGAAWRDGRSPVPGADPHRQPVGDPARADPRRGVVSAARPDPRRGGVDPGAVPGDRPAAGAGLHPPGPRL